MVIPTLEGEGRLPFIGRPPGLHKIRPTVMATFSAPSSVRRRQRVVAEPLPFSRRQWHALFHGREEQWPSRAPSTTVWG